MESVIVGGDHRLAQAAPSGLQIACRRPVAGRGRDLGLYANLAVFKKSDGRAGDAKGQGGKVRDALQAGFGGRIDFGGSHARGARFRC